MNDLRQEPNDLLAYWTRYDWRESFFAPGISILQALTAAGRTASGAGSTRESAFRRCLGETAELHALQELDAQIDTSMVGIAAHIDAGKAQVYAMLEAFERFAAHEWWYGRRAATQIPETWLQQIGLTSHLLQARHGAALKRRTAWWRIKTDADCPHVMICRSMSPEGQNLILGFGAAACPARAARKALREAFLMEMNLMELLAARNSGVSDPLRVVGEKIATYGRRCPALLPPGADWAPSWHEAAEISIDGARNWFGGEAELRDITPQGGPINVWICRPILAHHDDDAGTGLPYLQIEAKEVLHMPKGPDLHELEDSRYGCAPGPAPALRVPDRVSIRGVQPNVDPTDGAAYVTRQPPEILLRTTPEWRRQCLTGAAHIPSAYTYLGQLMGHDMGSSVALSSVPHVQRAEATDAVSILGPRRYNLIDNPLTLETVYGPGPMMLSHLYDPDTMLFRLTPGARLARVYRASHDPLSSSDDRPIRALYDERNRDTLMLHELAVAWMQFHNLCARTLMANGASPFMAYAMVRAHVVRVWHGIVRDDVLPRFLHPDIAAIPADDLPPEWQLDETTLLHGLFRAFHSLPLAAYDLGRHGVHNLADLLKAGYEISEAESDWVIDWPLFFGERPGGPRTGLSASVAPELRAPVSAAAVIALDNTTAIDARPLRAGNNKIEAAIAGLPDPWPARLTPQAIAQDFQARHPASPVRVTSEMIEWGPLFQAVMIEAQLHGQKGGLGPLGSALLRGSIAGSINRVILAPERGEARDLPRPETMMKLIELVRKV